MSDLISRQAAIDIFDDYNISVENGELEAYSRDRKRLCELPSAQPEQRWIPCSERLPEDLSEVNVTWINHNPEPYFEFSKDKPFTATAVYYKDKWYWYSATCADFLAEYGKCDWNEVDDAIEIVAWMPLPEPWEGEDNERA